MGEGAPRAQGVVDRRVPHVGGRSASPGPEAFGVSSGVCPWVKAVPDGSAFGLRIGRTLGPECRAVGAGTCVGGGAEGQPRHTKPLGSANAETTPAGAPAAAADRTQRPDATCEGKNGVTVQGPVKEPQPDGMSHGGGGEELREGE